MGWPIKNGRGTGSLAEVDPDGQLHVHASTVEEARWTSDKKGKAFIAVFEEATVNNETANVAYLENDDEDRDMVIEYVDMQWLDFSGGTAPVAAANYWEITTGEKYSADGSAVTPICLNRRKLTTPSTTLAYDSDPTLTGTEVVEWKRYANATEGHVEAPELPWGAFRFGKGEAFIVKLTTDETAGVALVNIVFSMVTPE